LPYNFSLEMEQALFLQLKAYMGLLMGRGKTDRTRMWANAQRDGRPAEYM